MVDFVEVTVYPRIHDLSFEVYWKVTDYLGFNVTFYVQRADAPDPSLMQDVSPALVDTYYYHDTDAYLYRRDTKYFYRIRMEYLANGNLVTKYSDIVSEPDPIRPEVKHIVKEDYIYLSRFVNEPIKVYKRKRYGKRCNECYDPIKGRVIRETCYVCYGTGFEGGYYGPFDTYWNRGLKPVANVLNQQASLDVPENTQAWMSIYPLLEVDDLIYSIKEGLLYKVNNIQVPRFRGYPIRQHIYQCNALNIGAPEYRLLESL